MTADLSVVNTLRDLVCCFISFISFLYFQVSTMLLLLGEAGCRRLFGQQQTTTYACTRVLYRARVPFNQSGHHSSWNGSGSLLMFYLNTIPTPVTVRVGVRCTLLKGTKCSLKCSEASSTVNGTRLFAITPQNTTNACVWDMFCSIATNLVIAHPYQLATHSMTAA